jgi:hypothetical protein
MILFDGPISIYNATGIDATKQAIRNGCAWQADKITVAIQGGNPEFCFLDITPTAHTHPVFI